MDCNVIPVLKLYSFVFWWNYHVFFSIIQHWVSSVLYSGLSKTFSNSMWTCCFSGKHRLYIFLTPTGSNSPCFLICHGALGEADCGPVVSINIVPIYWLDSLHGPQIWLTTSLIQDTSPLLPWPCAGAGGCALSGGALPCLQEVYHLRFRLIAPEPVDLFPDGVDKAALSMSTVQKGCKAAVSWWQ